MTAKPPYRIPSLEEIRAGAGRNGLSVVSTFSGAGGSGLGFEWEGYRLLWSSEFVAEAADVHELNFPDCPVDRRDIRNVAPETILEATGLRTGELDVLEGSPPCASFSMAGKREQDWGREKVYSSQVQRTDDLFFEFARLLESLRPRAFVAENVPGLRVGRARGYLHEIASRLVSCGYRVGVRELDAQWLGVPQVRRRLIFVGLRDDVAIGQPPPAPRPYGYRYSVADACPWLVALHTRAGRRSAALPCPTILTHGRRKTFSELTVDESKAPRESGPRRLELDELRRLAGFPDDFELTGNYAQQWERLGRAVPPPMAREIARALAEVLIV